MDNLKSVLTLKSTPYENMYKIEFVFEDSFYYSSELEENGLGFNIWPQR
jgi:hypothetical protein